MKFSYEEVLRETFGPQTFNVADVRRRTTLPHSKAVVSRLKSQGILERVGRGTYRLASPDRRRGVHATEYVLALEQVTRIPHAVLTLPTCLEIHTRGKYSVGRSSTSWPIHVASTPRYGPSVREALNRLPYPTGNEQDPVRRPGIFILFEVDALARPEMVDGMRVLARSEVRKRLTGGHPDESALALMP